MHVPTRTDLKDALDGLIAQRGTPLVIAHRGTPLGSFPDNTLRSAIGAVHSGADIVETDVIRSVDGEYFLFHTGFESKLFGTDADVRTMTAAELDSQVFRWQGGSRAPGVERLDTFLEGLPDTWINIDRSWDHWPHLLDHLAESGAADRVLLKSPPNDAPLRAMAEHPVPFLYFPIVRTAAELRRVASYSGIHLVGAELLAAAPGDDFSDPALVTEVCRTYPLVVMNAINLENGAVLYLGADDDTSILEDPDLGWGRLIDAGATAIQTDWPHLLRSYLAKRRPG